MRIIRYSEENGVRQLAVVTDQDDVYTIPFQDFLEFVSHARQRQIKPADLADEMIKDSLPLNKTLEELNVLVPIEAEEVWASGVTYEQSRQGRNYEATGGKMEAATFYDKVYEAERPEIFMKSTKSRTIGPGEAVHLRSDSNWQIPEPELALVLDDEGRITGFTIGNDMSCRDIEGENPLYLPQAKMWRNACSIGPAIRLAETVEDPYGLEIFCRIYRNDVKVFEGTVNTNRLKRKYEELCTYLLRDNVLLDGTVLLTGTGIVPPNDFTLRHGDRIEIEIPEIGTLINPVQSSVIQSKNSTKT